MTHGPEMWPQKSLAPSGSLSGSLPVRGSTNECGKKKFTGWPRKYTIFLVLLGEFLLQPNPRPISRFSPNILLPLPFSAIALIRHRHPPPVFPPCLDNPHNGGRSVRWCHWHRSGYVALPDRRGRGRSHQSSFTTLRLSLRTRFRFTGSGPRVVDCIQG